ncbi:MAG: hypothetical protein R3D31_08215 [Hyphomicrobiaceae bacterium]
MLHAATRASSSSRIVALLLLLLVAAPAALLAAPSGGINPLVGTWSGAGRITYTDGSNEGINCSAYYTGGGSDLRMAIQCRSDKNPIHIRSRLRVDGARVTGTWEERTFNASGSATGRLSSGRMTLKVSGSGFNGTMTVSFGGSSHSVTITTSGIAMSKATMRFNKR